MNLLPKTLAILSLLFLSLPAFAQDGPQNPNFEQGDTNTPPPGWFVPKPVADAGWAVIISDDDPIEGKHCLKLSRSENAGQSFGNVMQSFDATPFRGKTVVLKASVRFESVADAAVPSGRAQLWIRVDRPDQQQGFFNNMGNRPIVPARDGRKGDSRGWKEYTIIGKVDDDALGIAIGLMVIGGNGVASLDAVSLAPLGGAAGEAQPFQPPAPLTDQGLDNLIAFTRLLGFVRHFHPSDQAAATDWDRFAIAGVRQIESAGSATELATRLQSLFAPIAPSVVVSATPITDPFDPAAMLGSGDKPTQATAWRNTGFSTQEPDPQQIYSRKRITWSKDGPAPDRLPAPGDAVTMQLPGGVWCRVPLALYRDSGGTFPRPAAGAKSAADTLPASPAFIPSGDDRSTRLAAVALAWNIFQHFYPYFDVIKTDWPAALRQALREAATDADARAFTRTLERLVAQLHDGHGHVGSASGGGTNLVLPVYCAFVGDSYVVTRVAEGGGLPENDRPNPGDTILSIDGKPLTELFAEARSRISAAGPGWLKWRAQSMLTECDSSAPRTLELEAPDHTKRTVRIKPVFRNDVPTEPEPEKIAQLSPGIWYVDIDRINDDDFNKAIKDLAAAEGIVFDLRGYPGKLSTVVLSHLTDQPIRCAQWHIPEADFPDRQRMVFDKSDWPVMPIAPRLTTNVAFIIDGRAISYAETYMGIVEHFKLAEIVGQPTAGTNGNVNGFTRLPGEYFIAWTGMKVLKHDGSRHHGVGIIPTIPVERTIAGIAAGRDELLDAAVKAVSKNSTGEPVQKDSDAP